MTRACTCGVILGEKCRLCGARAVPVGNPPDGIGQLFRCSGECLYYFRVGDGGVTRGLCAACLEHEEAALITMASRRGLPLGHAAESLSLATANFT